MTVTCTDADNDGYCDGYCGDGEVQTGDLSTVWYFDGDFGSGWTQSAGSGATSGLVFTGVTGT